MFSWDVGAGEDLCARDSFLSFDFHQLPETDCVEVVQLTVMSPVDVSRFAGVKECSNNYSLADFKLGAKGDVHTLPDVSLPKASVSIAEDMMPVHSVCHWEGI